MTTSTQTQLRRGTSTQVAAMTPALGAPVVDTTNKRINIGDSSTAGGIPIPNCADIQSLTFSRCTVGGSANAITLTNIVPIAAYAFPQQFQFQATSTNTGGTTAAVDGLTAKNIYKLSSGSLVALTAGDIVAGVIYSITYDGTQFQLSSCVITPTTPSPITKVYAPADQTITAGGVINLTHGLGVIPKLSVASLVNITTEGGYTTGQEVVINPALNTSSTSVCGISICYDSSTTVAVRFGNNASPITLLNAGGTAFFSITPAKWHLRLFFYG